MLETAGLDSELGLTAAEVAAEADLSAPNATVALQRLAEVGSLTLVAGQRPARWRRT